MNESLNWDFNKTLNGNLTEKQKKFCAAYLKHLNLSKAVRESGYSLYHGYRLMEQPKIREYIADEKDKMFKNMMVDAYDVLNVYLRIAFADIKDFLEIGHAEDERDPRKSDYVRIKDVSDMDGQIVDEIVTTSYGIRLKLCDRMKALEKLEKYFELLGEDWRKAIAQEKVKLASMGKGDVSFQVITGIEREQVTGNK